MNVQQSVAEFTATFSDVLEGAQERIVSLVRTNGKKIAALSMATKMFTIATFFAILPVGLNPANSQSYDTNLKIERGASILLTENNKQTAIEIGESNFDKSEREKRETQVRQRIAAETPRVSVHNDPSDFRPIYQAAASQFGIPWQLLEAVHEVESGKSGSTSRGSYAGAQGPMQFMPGTWRAYGVDGNGDGATDITDVVDAIYGAAHLLARSGADEGRIDDALFNYNHAQWYVNKVKTIAYEIGM